VAEAAARRGVRRVLGAHGRGAVRTGAVLCAGRGAQAALASTFPMVPITRNQFALWDSFA
jgi:hypothetical protein